MAVWTGVVEAPADFMADFNSVFRADLGVFSTDFGSGVVSGVDLTIFKADFSSPWTTGGFRADLGLALKFDSGVAFRTDLGTTVNVLFFLGVQARDGVPRDNTAVEVDVLDIGVGVLEIEAGVLEIVTGVPEVGPVVWVLGTIAIEDVKGDASVLVIDTVFFLIMDA